MPSTSRKAGNGTARWQRVSRTRPCPICHKGSLCLCLTSEVGVEAAICRRELSRQPCGKAGWLHLLRDSPTWSPRILRIERSAQQIGGMGTK